MKDQSRARRRRLRPPVVPIEARIKIWLEAGGRYVFGFGMSEILKAVDAAGSIKEAARRLGKSYRYVWGRIKKAEESLGQSLVQTHVGGRGPCRSGLTGLARRLVADYDVLRQRMFDVAGEEFGHRFSSAPLSKGVREKESSSLSRP